VLYVVKRYNLDGVVDRQEPSFLHIYHRFKFGRSRSNGKTCGTLNDLINLTLAENRSILKFRSKSTTT